MIKKLFFIESEFSWGESTQNSKVLKVVKVLKVPTLKVVKNKASGINNVYRKPESRNLFFQIKFFCPCCIHILKGMMQATQRTRDFFVLKVGILHRLD